MWLDVPDYETQLPLQSLTFNDLGWIFYVHRAEALRGWWKRNELSAPYICLPLFSFPLLPLHPSLFRCFCMIRTIGSFPAYHPCIYLYFSALEPVLYTYTMYASSIYSLKSCARASVTYRELCAVPGNKHHDSWIAKHLDFDYKWWSRCRINGDCMGFARQGDISRPRT